MLSAWRRARSVSLRSLNERGRARPEAALSEERSDETKRQRPSARRIAATPPSCTEVVTSPAAARTSSGP
jgi:hypothetical protein